METLLGQFYSKIKGSQEDIASEGLAYILQRAENRKVIVNKIIKPECEFELPDLTFSTQNVGEKLERPDISGYDDNNKERVIFESKFWSSLTENQPIEYLNRLSNDSVIIFVCPNLRVRPIYTELLYRLKKSTLEYIPDENTNSIVILTINKHILIRTWDEVLDTIRNHVSKEGNHQLVSDIDQIIGFCEIIDKNAFLPIQSEELSPLIPKRINSYYGIVDKVVDEIKKHGKFNTKGLKATPQYWGYRRYVKVYNFGLSIDVNFEYWEKKLDTPFWFGIQLVDEKGRWTISDEILIICKKLSATYNLFLRDRLPYFAMLPAINATEDIVVKDMSKFIIDLVERIYLDLTD